MKYSTEELKEMNAKDLNKVLLRQPVYMVSKFGGQTIDEKKCVVVGSSINRLA